MTKKIFLFLIILILTSCNPGASTSPAFGTATSQAVVKATQTPSSMACTVFHIPVTPQPLAGESNGRGHILGPDTAPVTIIFYTDYQCPVCAYLSASLLQVRENHVNDVRLVFLDTWLEESGIDALAFRAAEAANLQGKYWEMNTLLFDNLDQWRQLSETGFRTWVFQQAQSLGLDTTQFLLDFDGETIDALLHQAAPSVESSSIRPPTVYINGAIPFLVDYASLESTVSLEILSARQFSACPPWVIDPSRQYLATLDTVSGKVVLQLFPDKAPQAVNNFVFLAQSGWYDNTSFYRVIPNSVVQAGDPSGTGLGNPGYLFTTEIPAGLDFSQAGMVAIENNGANTNGSRFFITLGPQVQSNGQSTIFGQVISGMEVLNALSARDPGIAEILPPGDELLSVTIEER